MAATGLKPNSLQELIVVLDFSKMFVLECSESLKKLWTFSGNGRMVFTIQDSLG